MENTGFASFAPSNRPSMAFQMPLYTVYYNITSLATYDSIEPNGGLHKAWSGVVRSPN